MEDDALIAKAPPDLSVRFDVRLNSEQIKQLVSLQRFIEEEQGSIDSMLLIAQAGFHEAPFEALCSCYDGELESWQEEEFGEALGRYA